MIPNVRNNTSNGEVSRFPYAPDTWTEQDAVQLAKAQGIELDEDHFELLGVLQAYFNERDRPDIRIRQLHDALDERFHARGGMKYLYQLFPGGPVAQGCRLAGLAIPSGAVNESFGSVQ